MGRSTIRKAIGAVKDQTSIGLAFAKASSNNVPPGLDVAILKATSHDDAPADEKHIREILTLTSSSSSSSSRCYASACVSTLSRRLAKTRDWIVALKALVLVHRLITEGIPDLRQELLYATRRGARLLNMSDFRDEAHCSSWDHSAFVRAYALYLDKRLECMVGDHSSSDPPRSEERRRLLGRMRRVEQMFDRLLACRPVGLAKNNRMIFAALCPIVRESFELYADICEILAGLLDGYFDMEYAECVKSFEAYASAAKQIDELDGFYWWCKDTGVARSSEYPEVQRITDELLETMKEFVKDREAIVEPESTVREEEPAHDMVGMKAKEQQVPEEPKPQIQPLTQGELVDLREDAGTDDAEGNKLALAILFTGAVGAAGNSTWEAFPSSEGSGEEEVTSAWQTAAAEEGKADWELALVETASKLANQKAALGGGFDPLLLNGMYDQGAVRQHVSAHASIGSASSVTLPGPDGTVQNIGVDPFAASLSFPPPSYVQMYDIEKQKQQQQLLMQEQQLWHQYTGMQGQASLAKLNNAFYYPNPVMQYGMSTPAAYYHPNV